ncbi:MAG: hypothetical protein IPM49_02685 [Flavobacteriales bacterium]|nr:hypothetical protein [Flavobacteriales bacterium]
MLSSYINVYNTCLVILRKRGFYIRHEADKELWYAEYSGFVFCADNPIELLGLVGIYDELKPTSDTEDWWKVDHPDVLAEFD